MARKPGNISMATCIPTLKRTTVKGSRSQHGEIFHKDSSTNPASFGFRAPIPGAFLRAGMRQRTVLTKPKDQASRTEQEIIRLRSSMKTIIREVQRYCGTEYWPYCLKCPSNKIHTTNRAVQVGIERVAKKRDEETVKIAEPRQRTTEKEETLKEISLKTDGKIVGEDAFVDINRLKMYSVFLDNQYNSLTFYIDICYKALRNIIQEPNEETLTSFKLRYIILKCRKNCAEIWKLRKDQLESENKYVALLNAYVRCLNETVRLDEDRKKTVAICVNLKCDVSCLKEQNEYLEAGLKESEKNQHEHAIKYEDIRKENNNLKVSNEILNRESILLKDEIEILRKTNLSLDLKRVETEDYAGRLVELLKQYQIAEENTAETLASLEKELTITKKQLKAVQRQSNDLSGRSQADENSENDLEPKCDLRINSFKDSDDEIRKGISYCAVDRYVKTFSLLFEEQDKSLTELKRLSLEVYAMKNLWENETDESFEDSGNKINSLHNIPKDEVNTEVKNKDIRKNPIICYSLAPPAWTKSGANIFLKENII